MIDYRQVIFVTNRVVDFTAEARAFRDDRLHWLDSTFTQQLGPDLSFGSVYVSYPSDRQRGEQNYPLSRYFENPLYHFFVKGIRWILDPTDFNFRLRNRFDVNSNPLVYLHGYLNSFEDAVVRGAQLSMDLEDSNPPIVFDWPSDHGGLSKSAYFEAARNSVASEHVLALTLADIEEVTGAQLNYVSHSMGSRLLTGAMLQLRAVRGDAGDAPDPHPGAVILAAPDIERDYFDKAIKPKLLTLGVSLTVYCTDDRALVLAYMLDTTGYRLGYCPGPIPDIVGVDMVAAHLNGLGMINHDYFATRTEVLDDMKDVLKRGHLRQPIEHKNNGFDRELRQ